jgi:hypothetical protein
VSDGRRPDFGAVVVRHRVDPSEFARLDWILLLVFLDIVMLGAGLFFVPRPAGPQAVYFGMWVLFSWGIVRLAYARRYGSGAVVLERGIFMPVYRPIHRARLHRRAVPFDRLKRVRLDSSSYRTGAHTFEAEGATFRCSKVYFPPAKRLAQDLKELAPEVEVVLVDGKGRRRTYAPMVTRRRGKKPGGPRAGAK